METTGVIFIATGEKYVKAAQKAAFTVINYCPGLPIHLFSDEKSLNLFIKKDHNPFTSFEKIENPHHRSKVDCMALTPYDRTLYLDTDTALNSDISDAFRVLERFDIAMTHAMHRSQSRLKKLRIHMPDAFPEFNTGVIFFRKTPDVLNCLKAWEMYFKEMGQYQNNDQTTLRELLWLSDLRIATLPPEYNVRYLKYHFLWSKSEAETKIFHLKQLHKGWVQWLLRKPKRINKLLSILGLRKNKRSRIR